MKTAVLVFGAQRSGTSATSHLLSRLGVNFGDRQHFLQDKHNPIFFELKWVNQYNDRLLQAMGHRYTDFFLPLEADYETPSVQIMAAELPTLIRQEWQDAPLIGLKDPRFSLTFPVWEQALQSSGYAIRAVLVFRSPSGFLRSNQKLFDQWEGWDEIRHLRFWLQFNLAALYFARNAPFCSVSYETLVHQPLRITKQLADWLKLSQADLVAAAAVIDKTYQHYPLSFPTGDVLIDTYYQQLCSHSLSAIDYLNYRDSVASNTGGA